MFRGRSALVPIGGRYELEKCENAEAFLKELGASDDFVQKAVKPGNILEIVEDGDKFSFIKGDGTSLSIVLNQEYEELYFGLKSIGKREGNTLIFNSRTPDGRSGIRTGEFTDYGFNQVMTFNGITAKSFYKRI